MDAIEVEGVSKKFKEKGKDFWALKDVSLRVKKGEVVGLLGPNGAGKTTLLNIMIRLLTPDSGEVRILGEDVQKGNRYLERINFVSGDTRFHWVLRATDILHFYAVAYRIPKEERERRIGELISFFNIERVKSRRFSSLSTGERMRLIFAKAMLNKPEILLLDEPTLGLDPSIAIRVRKEIKRMNREFGTAILLTSHYMNEVEQLSDRIAFINKGRIVDTGRVEKVKLRMFEEYDVFIKVGKVFDREFLRKNDFQVSGLVLRKRLPSEEGLTEVLSLLHKRGYTIMDVQSRKPTLEDYFVKILHRENREVEEP